MSLLENLNQKRALKEQEKQAAIVQEKKQTFAEISTQVSELTAKKQKITTLKESLLANYEYGDANKKLDVFKNKKAELQGAYEENKDILEEEGVENFEGMLEENANEPEVRNYRRAGGRGPSKIKDSRARILKNEDEEAEKHYQTEAEKNGEPYQNEAGETGELYKAVGTLKEIKDSLQAEMPEVKLNFSAVTRKDEELSNRELSFAQVDEYLKNLEKEIIVLNKQKEEAYLKTPEGVREALNNIQDQNPEYVFRNKDFQNSNRFAVNNEVLKLAEKTGLEPIKQIYTKALSKQLESIAWKNKNKNQRDQYQKSDEQTAIENYPILNKLETLRYDQADVAKMEEEYQTTVKHIAAVLEANKKITDSLTSYGLSSFSTREDTQRMKKDDWSDGEILASGYIKYAASVININDPEDLLRSLKNATEKAESKNWDRSALNPEALHNDFEKFNKFLEYLRNNVNNESKLVDDGFKGENILSQLKNDRETIKKVEGSEKIDRNIEVPDIVRGHGNYEFHQALEKSERYWQPWQKEKQGIAEISKTAVDDRFAKASETYFINKNKETLENFDYNEKLEQGINKVIPTVNTMVELNQKFGNTKIKLMSEANSSYSSYNSAIKNISEVEDYRVISRKMTETNQKIDNYANAKMADLNKEINKVAGAFIAFGKANKISALREKKDIFERFKKNEKLHEETVKKAGLSEEEIIKMKAYREEKDKNDQDYKEHDAAQREFSKLVEIKNINLNFKNKDILNGQETIFSKLPGLLEARLIELKTENNNLPEEERLIKEERERLSQESETSEKKFQSTIQRNMEVIRKNSN